MTEPEAPSQAVLDALAEWINEGGWTVTFCLGIYENEQGVRRGAQVRHVELGTETIRLTLTDGAALEVDGVEFKPPDAFEPNLRIKMITSRHVEGKGILHAVHEKTQILVLTAPAHDDGEFIVKAPRWDEFLEICERLHAEREIRQRHERFARLAAKLRQAHPSLGAIRAVNSDGRTVVEIGLTDGTILRLGVVEIGDNSDGIYEPGAIHLTIDDFIVEYTPN